MKKTLYFVCSRQRGDEFTSSVHLDEKSAILAAQHEYSCLSSFDQKTSSYYVEGYSLDVEYLHSLLAMDSDGEVVSPDFYAPIEDTVV